MKPIEQSSESRELVLVRLIDAPREQVFRAWTDPVLLQQWFTPFLWFDHQTEEAMKRQTSTVFFWILTA
jgi:uncharacterized protein YndB with AHSA1/START domain